jgi:predicted transcriptional regulator
MKTPLHGIRIPDELWGPLERIGEALDRSPSWVIRKAIEEYIDRYRAAKRAEKAAEQAVDPKA